MGGEGSDPYSYSGHEAWLCDMDDGGVDLIETTPTNPLEYFTYSKGGSGGDVMNFYQYGDINCAKGLSGDDYIYGDEGIDYLFGNGGVDEIYGNDYPDVIDGGVGADYVSGGPYPDILYGGYGDDVVYGNASGDSLFGGYLCVESWSIPYGAGSGTNYYGYHAYDPDGDGIWESGESWFPDVFYLPECSTTGGADELYGGGGNDYIWEGNSDNWSDGEADYVDGGNGTDFCAVGPEDTYVNCENVNVLDEGPFTP